MKRLLAALLVVLLHAGVAPAASEKVTVVVKKTSIRSDRQFYAPTLAEAVLDQSFDVLGREKGWVKVGTKAGPGWLHETAVTSRKVAASGKGPAGEKVDEQDVAAAGKQFTPEVEHEYRKKNPAANYPAVDRMERVEVEGAAIEAFAREGHLAPRETGK